MRKIFALILIALLLGVGVVAIIETDPGYLLLAYGDYTLESSLWVGLVLLFLFTLLLYFVIALLRRLVGGQKSLSGWLDARRQRQATRLTNRGLVHFIEGNWSRARRELLRGARNNEAPLVNYLLAARASARLDEPDQIEQHLLAAADSNAAADTAVALARAELQLQAGQYRQAITTLQDARRNPGRYPQALSLLQRAYTGLGDSAGLAELLPQLKKHRVINADEQAALEQDIYGGMLRSAGTGGDASLDAVADTWNKLPSAVRADPEMVRGYISLLVSLGGDAQAEKAILRELKKRWDETLVRLYGFVKSENVRRQLAHAESWLAEHPEDAQLFLCLGRLAARDKLWGKSRDYFEKSYRLQRSAETCAELGRLLEGLGEAKVAAAYYREGLLLQEARLPSLPKPEKMVPDQQLLTRG